MANKPWQGFNTVDAEDNPEFYAQYLDHLRTLGDTKTYKAESFLKLNLNPGDAVLDIGCGIGQDAECLATLLGPTSHVCGVDPSESLLAIARQRAAQKHVEIHYQKAPADALPFPDNTFHACRADRVFLYLPDMHSALKEMYRVLKPTGVLYVRDPDMDSYFVDAPGLDLATTRAVVHYFSDSFNQGNDGRQLRRLLLDTSLKNVQYEPKTLILTAFKEADEMFAIKRTVNSVQQNRPEMTEALNRWLETLENASIQNRFTFGLTFFACYGIK